MSCLADTSMITGWSLGKSTEQGSGLHSSSCPRMLMMKKKVTWSELRTHVVCFLLHTALSCCMYSNLHLSVNMCSDYHSNTARTTHSAVLVVSCDAYNSACILSLYSNLTYSRMTPTHGCGHTTGKQVTDTLPSMF